MSSDPRALLQQAQKAYSDAGKGFSIFGGREEKYENAANMFVQAANAFKRQKQNIDAGKAFEQAVQIQTKSLSDSLIDATANLVNAANAYNEDDPEAAIRCLNQVVERHCTNGDFRRAASHKETMGGLQEKLGDTKGAMESYEEAADWYEGENSKALANKLRLKAADIAAIQGDYYKAITNFETVADRSLDNNLMKYSVKDYFFKAGICHLASGDMVGAQRALDSYRAKDPSFAAQKEYKLLVDLAEAVDAKSAEQYEDKCFMFNQVATLDGWKIEILTRAKNQIQEADDEFA